MAADAHGVVRPSADSNDKAADVLGLDAAKLSHMSPEALRLSDDIESARSLSPDSPPSSGSEVYLTHTVISTYTS